MGAAPPEHSLPFPEVKLGTYSCHGIEPGNQEGVTANKARRIRICSMRICTLPQSDAWPPAQEGESSARRPSADQSGPRLRLLPLRPGVQPEEPEASALLCV